jgi:hypothetical protein
VWRDKFHARLLELALAEKDANRRNAALADLGAGIARSSDEACARSRVDELLLRAAELDPDTSPIRAAVARAQALAGRWEAAEDCAFSIAREALRDSLLSELGTLALASTAPDRVGRALSLVGGIEAPALRRERLRELGSRPELLDDPRAYGELLALLADAPEILAEVTAAAVSERPALADAFVPDARGPVTERERRLAEAARTSERQSIMALLDRVMPAASELLRATGIEKGPR